MVVGEPALSVGKGNAPVDSNAVWTDAASACAKLLIV